MGRIMNLSEVNWDFNAAATWPLPVKIGAVVLVSLLVAVAGIYTITLDQLNKLEQLEQKEQALKSLFEDKQRKIVNLADYRKQLVQIELSLSEMIKQMPTKVEMDNLLIDISQTGLASGLEFRFFKPASTIRKDFYSELPVNIQVIGQYGELGLFVSGLASLPRIVTVHDVVISAEKSPLLKMNATIKTYKEETGEIQAKKDKKGRRR